MVPGMVVATSVVTVAAGVLEPTTAGVKVTVSTGNVVGRIVVPGMVVVYVISAPRALAGIALPTPEAVYCVGRVNVAVFGFEAGSEP